MASSGTINNTFRSGYAIRITWTVNSQSVANNTSNVTANVQLVSLGSSYTIVSTATKSGSLTINGTTYNFTFSAALSGNQTKTIYTKTVDIAHFADGTKTCAFSCKAGIAVTLSGVYWGTVSTSGTGTFNTIPRASSIASVTSSVAVNGSNTVTVSITRQVSSFTHTVKYSIGSYSYTASNVATSNSYAIPLAWLNAIPNATSGKVAVVVTTYNGSTKIGQASSSFTITVPSSIVPTINAVNIAENVAAISSQFGAYVQNKSKLNVSINASGVYSSSITQYRTVILGAVYTSSSFTSGYITSSGSVTISITITDSRGRQANTTRSITVLAYSLPRISKFDVYRSNGTGTQIYEGCCVSASIKFDISAVNDLNEKSYLIEYKLKTASSWVTLASGSVYAYDDTMIFHEILTVDNSYDIRLTVSDTFATDTATTDIPTAFTLVDFMADGKTIAFGKVAEQPECVEFGIPAIFSYGESPYSAKELEVDDDLNAKFMAGFYVIPSAAVSAGLLNKPWTNNATGFLLVLNCGNQGQRVQFAYKVDKASPVLYERCYYTSAWGSWHVVFSI